MLNKFATTFDNSSVLGLTYSHNTTDRGDTAGPISEIVVCLSAHGASTWLVQALEVWISSGLDPAQDSSSELQERLSPKLKNPSSRWSCAQDNLTASLRTPASRGHPSRRGFGSQSTALKKRSVIVCTSFLPNQIDQTQRIHKDFDSNSTWTSSFQEEVDFRPKTTPEFLTLAPVAAPSSQRSRFNSRYHRRHR